MSKNLNRTLIPLLVLVGGLLLLALGPGAPRAAAADEAWRARYWNNRNLSGDPVVQRDEAEINNDWGGGRPHERINDDNFSVRWTRAVDFSAGNYRFTATMDDGMRVWIDDQLLIDAWTDSQVRTLQADRVLTGGTHNIRIDYFEAGGVAVAKFNWQQIGAAPAGIFTAWKGEYFNNMNLSGQPSFLRDDREINFNWSVGSPAAGIAADQFSVRWTRQLNFPAGTYRFDVFSDDGVRLWVNNVLVIDQWRVQPPTSFSVDIDLPGGAIPIKMEYFENTERAYAKLTWQRIGTTPPPTSSAWRAEYFSNMSLSGQPVVVRDEGAVNYSWGYGTPAPQVPVDHFSARWTANLNFPSGRYRFSATSDDGVRVWVNNQLIIDAWFDRPAQTSTAEFTSPGGVLPVRIEYYENTALAEMRFGYTSLTGTGGQFPGTGTVTSYRLNVRTGPGTNFAVITRLSTGNVVNLTGYRNGDATWVQVSLANGTVGWVSALYLRTTIPVANLTPITGTTTPPTPPAGALGTVNTGALNVRTGPDVGYPAFTSISNGTTVTLLARNAASTWVKVILRDGRQGWVNASFLILNVSINSLPVSNL